MSERKRRYNLWWSERGYLVEDTNKEGPQRFGRYYHTLQEAVKNANDARIVKADTFLISFN